MKTLENLYDTLNDYLHYEVDGDDFNNEKDFEEAVRDLLQHKGFDVPDEKHNVEHLEKMFAESAHNVEKQIPDIVVVGYDFNNKVFLEVKYCNVPKNYKDDIKKVQNYINQRKCNASGVLFIDRVSRDDWKMCKANPKYNYYLDIFY